MRLSFTSIGSVSALRLQAAAEAVDPGGPASDVLAPASVPALLASRFAEARFA